MPPSNLFLRNIYARLRTKPLTLFSLILILGFLVGILLSLVLLGQDASGPWALVIGAFLGVFAGALVDFAALAIALRREIEPLSRSLGTIATDNPWIYVSAWRRDVRDLDHSRLFRNDPQWPDQPSIVGSPYVYGKGDAIALALLFQVIQKASRGKARVTVEDSEHVLDLWGRTAICIGAHNSKTREVLAKFANTYYRFDQNYRTIVSTSSKQVTNRGGVRFIEAVSQSQSGDSMGTDYGIILKLRDEYHPEKTVMLVAGLGDAGTAGAAYYLLTHFRDLPYEQSTFGVLIQVPSGYQSARRVEFEKVAEFMATSE
jgi:hypothetical protein